MEAVVLAGGLGTRLRPLTESVPKPMLEVAGRPFLEYVLNHLVEGGVSKICLAVGYKAELIVAHFGHEYKGVDILYSVEREPLGTGGAIKKASGNIEGESFLVVNADTAYFASLSEMAEFHEKHSADITVAGTEVEGVSRFGVISLSEDGRIVGFAEKVDGARGIINAGQYMINRSVMEGMGKNVFSFEKDVLEGRLKDLRCYAFVRSGSFIDIGIKEDLERANRELA